MKHQTTLVLAVVLFMMAAVVVGLFVSTEGLTGGIVTKTITCFDDADCNDDISITEDVCKNPGTLDALCFNRPKP